MRFHIAKRILFYITACIVITSCNDDTTVLSDQNTLYEPLSISTLILTEVSLTRTSLLQSEGAVTGTTLFAGSRMGVTLTPASLETRALPVVGIPADNSSNLQWVNNGDATNQKWQYISPEGVVEPYLLDEKRMNIFAYYPYDPKFTLLNGYDASGQQFPAIEIRPGYKDFLYGKGLTPVNSRQPVSAITLNHAMAMISFVFSNDASYRGPCVLQSLVVKNIPQQALMTLNDGTITSQSSQGDSEIRYYDRTLKKYYPVFNGSEYWIRFKDEPNFGITSMPQAGTSLEEISNFHLFVIPSEATSSVGENNVYLEIKIDNILYTIPFPNDRTLTNGVRGFTWKKGVNSLYRITLTKNNVLLTYLLDDYEPGGNPDFDFGRLVNY